MSYINMVLIKLVALKHLWMKHSYELLSASLNNALRDYEYEWIMFN